MRFVLPVLRFDGFRTLEGKRLRSQATMRMLALEAPRAMQHVVAIALQEPTSTFIGKVQRGESVALDFFVLDDDWQRCAHARAGEVYYSWTHTRVGVFDGELLLRLQGGMLPDGALAAMEA